jgi:chitin disaccharide deacetylase
MKNKLVAALTLLLLPFLLSTQTPQPASPRAHNSQPAQNDSTYADRLGFPKGARVLILHVDDAGMSLESNEGAIAALTKGAATSVSVMMPCPWVPGFVKWLRTHPDIDAGLHLTLTSEWNDYRWGPVAGRSAVPGLTDSTGNLWQSVADVARHATPDEIAAEISAQLNRARAMGFQPTHLDTHMGTVYATPEFLKRYMQIGITNHIPVMLPGGADKLIQQQTGFSDAQVAQIRALGTILWNAGLPVLDDLHNFSYDWKVPDSLAHDDLKLQRWRTALYINALTRLQPGVTMMIMHCSDAGPTSPTSATAAPSAAATCWPCSTRHSKKPSGIRVSPLQPGAN